MAGIKGDGREPAPLLRQLPATPESVSVARHEIADYLRRLDAPSHEIEVAVTEAVKNAVEHAFPPRRDGSIWLSAEPLVPDTLSVEVADDGVGITPDLQSEGLGLGLSLIGRFSTDFEVRERKPYGTVVVMRFSLAREVSEGESAYARSCREVRGARSQGPSSPSR